MRAQRVRTGFTLVELIVVISVVALLIAILLPSMKNARESARAAVCLSNMRQVGMSMLMYGDSNGGAVLFHENNPLTGEDAVHWLALLRPYIKTADIVRCHSDRSQSWEDDPFSPTIGVRTTSFVSNNRMTPDAAPPIRRWSEVKAPARKIFLAELKDNIIGDHFHPLSWSVFLSVPEDEIAMTRHNGRSNYWFVDGHVDKLPFQKTWRIDGRVDYYDPKDVP